MLLDGRVAVVTGGGRGIGADITRVLGRHGAKVAAVYCSSRERTEGVCAEVRQAGGEARAFQADVRDAESVQAMVSAVVEVYGRVDGVVNNAISGRQYAPFDEATWQDYVDMYDFGCKAVVNTVRALKPVFAEQGDGRVVNIVTELWNMGSGEWSTYLAGKGAMVGLSRSLANELGPLGIRVNMIAPGWMADEKVDPTSEASIGFGKGLPLGYHGGGDEIGKACVFLLSDLASYITGAYLPVTGGRVTQMGA